MSRADDLYAHLLLLTEAEGLGVADMAHRYLRGLTAIEADTVPDLWSAVKAEQDLDPQTNLFDWLLEQSPPEQG